MRREGEAHSHLIEVPDSDGVAETVKTLEADPDIASATPNYVATESVIPNDRGRLGERGGWQHDQWNFLRGDGGVNAPDAWANLIEAGRPGAKGVTVAIVDTGIAYRRKGRRFRRDPDLKGVRFRHPRDLVENDSAPLDEDGHGTHVASTIAQATGNARGLTGLAYGATIMPVRVLDEHGQGTALDVARGIRFAIRNGADVINLSLEFDVGTCEQIPDVCGYVSRAAAQGVVVVAAAGNTFGTSVALPGAAPGAIGTGATTERGCVADYSGTGSNLDIVAPGGGRDLATAKDEDPPGISCKPAARPREPIRQYSLFVQGGGKRRYKHFGFVGERGTSMAAAHVSGAAAMVIASGILGPDPTSDQVRDRLLCTSRKGGKPTLYGAGLLDAAAATDPAVSCPPD